MDTKHVELDRSAFEAWLRSKTPGSYVGLACHPESCPIYHWQEPNGVVSVERDYITYVTKDEQLPRWASRFVSLLDEQYEEPLPVTAQEALNVLSTID